MQIDILLFLICGGFMCICGGFGTYGCYRCCTDKERRRIGSENSSNNSSLRNSFKIYKKRNLCRNSSVSSSKSSSFTGTIYTVCSVDSFREKNTNASPSEILNKNHDYALSINPEIIKWSIRDSEGGKHIRRTKTAPS